jgi:hypothetical protein
MAHTRTLLVGTGVGGTLAYFLDPGQGRRRRALVRDKATSALRRAREALDATFEDARNRARGIVAETRGRLTETAPPPDDVLVERVRARLGLVASFPGAIEVRAEQGRVTLSGPVPANEVRRIAWTARRVRGVRSVDDCLEPHATPDVPALQGTPSAAAQRAIRPWRTWSPTARAAAIAAAAIGLTRARRYAGTVLAASVVGILGRTLARRDQPSTQSEPGTPQPTVG